MYLAYVYKLTHKLTNEFYIGYRYANIKLCIKPKDDLGLTYFSSATYINKDNFNEYNADILLEFDSPDDAYDYETMLIMEHWENPLLLNRHLQSSDQDRFRITEAGVEKLRVTNAKKHWYTNGITERHSEVCPVGFLQGRMRNPFPAQSGWVKGYSWFTNGKEYTMAKTAPVGFVKGKRPASSITNQKISDAMKNGGAHATGKKWYTNGVTSVLAFTCPTGWLPGHSNGGGNSHKNRDYSGYHWYTNGVKSIRAKECPIGFVAGRII